jgi:HemY protein
MSKAAKAERYLKRPELTNLVTAQAAEMAGDRKKAEEVYKRLLADERTRFVGVRGIMKQKIAEGDTAMALKLAEKAFALKPRHEETQDVLLRLQAEQHDWKGARKTLSTKLKYGALPRPVHKRRDAVLALGEAKDIVDDNKSIEAREAAIEANRLSPDLVPAAAMAARAYVARDQRRYATRILKKAWGAIAPSRPRHRLRRDRAERDAEAAAEAVRGADAGRTPAHAETRLLLAELNVASEDFAAARTALGDLPETAPNARVLALLAAIERGEGAPTSGARASHACPVRAARAAMGLRQLPQRGRRLGAGLLELRCLRHAELAEPPATRAGPPARRGRRGAAAHRGRAGARSRGRGGRGPGTLPDDGRSVPTTAKK